MFYTFESEAPYRVTGITRPFHFPSPTLEGAEHERAADLIPQIQFGAGMVLIGDLQDELLISFGTKDCIGSLVKIKLAIVLQAIKENTVLAVTQEQPFTKFSSSELGTGGPGPADDILVGGKDPQTLYKDWSPGEPFAALTGWQVSQCQSVCKAHTKCAAFSISRGKSSCISSNLCCWLKTEKLMKTYNVTKSTGLDLYVRSSSLGFLTNATPKL